MLETRICKEFARLQITSRGWDAHTPSLYSSVKVSTRSPQALRFFKSAYASVLGITPIQNKALLSRSQEDAVLFQQPAVRNLKSTTRREEIVWNDSVLWRGIALNKGASLHLRIRPEREGDFVCSVGFRPLLWSRRYPLQRPHRHTFWRCFWKTRY